MRTVLFCLWCTALVCLAAAPKFAAAQDNSDCLTCHEDPDLTGERDGGVISVFVGPEVFARSVHGELTCVTCHADLEGVELPHDVPLERVECGTCHDDIAEVYDNSLHGLLAHAGEKLAPRCRDCHGVHDILPATDDSSRVTKFNIPFMCGRCHKEGTAVTQTYDIPQDSILTHYSFSIHGEGLYKQGLTVTAVCSDCHTAHNVLPHTDPRSTIYRANVPQTCAKCHGRIETVHKKVIRGELWETEPNKIPVCIDCHEPHKVRKLYYEEGIADRECLECHGRQDLTAVRGADTVSLYVDSLLVKNGVHRREGVSCAQCHTGATPSPHERPCSTIRRDVDCSICHAAVVATHAESVHGRLAERGDPDAPACNDCHGVHYTTDHRDPQSPTYPINVPQLCGNCHREGKPAAARYTGNQHNILDVYSMSVHGKGLLESGLVVTAMCTDCHTPHHVLPADDPASSIYRKNIPQTCAECHKGIYEQYSRSIHSPGVSHSTDPLPVCNDCHSDHAISSTGDAGFTAQITGQCGRCHEEVTASYFETFHGKVSKLGFAAAAKCHDCHGAHDILPTYDPDSHLSRDNIVATCGKCHEGSNRRFAGYLTHATHHDKDKYPILFYTFWFMSGLLMVTLAVAGTHTIMWLPRSFQMMKKHKKMRQRPQRLVYRRFTRRQRQLHVLVVISFLGLAITGMTLKFSYLGWAQWLSALLGGFESAGFVHRICAVITFFYFATHLLDLRATRRRSGISWKEFLLHKNSMLPNSKDWQDLKGSIKWFLGLGPRPAYGRWTYWEKFDYFAVFWGVVIIGSTGLMLWFPEFFTRFLPGWIINVATIVHSDEALLAAGFIFTVHFFNTHFRPDKFPMDTVIFTGRMPVEEFMHDRPEEYRELMKTRQLKKYLIEPMPEPMVTGAKIFGSLALFLGLSLVLLIIWAEVFGYR
jgi:cytochrome b subunit of formate dehydrogenase